MNEIRAQENAVLDLSAVDEQTQNDLLEIGVQIKEKLGLKALPIQWISSGKARIGNIIGNLCLNDTRLIITPKITDRKEAVKALYERTLQCSMGNLGATVYFTKSSVVDQEDVFPDILASIFVSALTKGLRGSRIMQYEERTEKLSVIKGRVMMGKQLSSPVLDEKTWCKYHKMSVNNVYNQLLFWTCRYLGESVHHFELKKRLRMLSREFVAQVDLLSVFSVRSLRFTRQYSEYVEALSIAQSLYLGSGGKRQTGKVGGQICGYVINMEKAFENIVSRYTKLAAVQLGFSHKKQATIRFALASGGYDYDYDIRPDDLVSDGQKHLVMDAKYKILSKTNGKQGKPSRDDFYQMVSSCIAYDCPEAILIYPLSAQFPSQAWSTVRTVNGRQITVKSVGLDILDDENQLQAVLTTAMQESYLYKEKVI